MWGFLVALGGTCENVGPGSDFDCAGCDWSCLKNALGRKSNS
jgi:hypothetical protein